MNILFISDSFVAQNPAGGAERADQSFINSAKDHSFTQKLSYELSEDDVNGDYDLILVSNFLGLKPKIKELISTKRYRIIEHDFKMILGRNPNLYEDYQAPNKHIVNREFYKKAEFIFFQSIKHRKIAEINLPGDNYVIGGNIFDLDELNYIESFLSLNNKKFKCAVLEHPYPNKNTKGSIDYCNHKKLSYLSIPRTNYRDYIYKLSLCETLVFLPTILETYSRVSADARCLGLDIISNDNNSFMFQPEYNLKGVDLINFYRLNNDKIINLVLQ